MRFKRSGIAEREGCRRDPNVGAAHGARAAGAGGSEAPAGAHESGARPGKKPRRPVVCGAGETCGSDSPEDYRRYIYICSGEPGYQTLLFWSYPGTYLVFGYPQSVFYFINLSSEVLR